MELWELVLMLLAGIGLFIFAMKLIEDAIRNLAGRTVKLFLRRITNNKLKAVVGSALITGLLQGSSVVMVMLLAFAGAGVLSVSSAIAVVLGANLGTTIDSWIVATLGFKINIESFSYPAIIIAAVLQVVSDKGKYKNLSGFLFGFGLLFIAISVMKGAVTDQVKHLDFAAFSNIPLWQFTLIGLIITSLIQSSLATMAISLSALHAGVISFPVATAIVIGSEVGTTLKIFLGAIDGNRAKKILASANFIINSITAIVAFIILKPLIGFITIQMGIKDPLIGLVTFQTFINVISIIIFLPFVNRFAKILENAFKDSTDTITSYINKEEIVDPLLAFEMFNKEALYFLYASIVFNQEKFGLQSAVISLNNVYSAVEHRKRLFDKAPHEQYEHLKSLHGALQLYYLKLRYSTLPADNIHRLEHLISAVRSMMHSSKSMNDISSNINNLHQSSKDVKYQFYTEIREKTRVLYNLMEELFSCKREVSFSELKNVYDQILSDYSGSLDAIYKSAVGSSLNSDDFTTLMNLNRELFTSHKALLMAAKDFLLDAPEADRFADLPVYTT